MSEIIKLPGSFIRLPVIQDRFQEEICEACERFILDVGKGGRCSQFFMCEGSRCVEANEFFEDTHEELDYIFYYHESAEVKAKINELDSKIVKLGIKLNSQIKILNIQSCYFTPQRKLDHLKCLEILSMSLGV